MIIDAACILSGLADKTHAWSTGKDSAVESFRSEQKMTFSLKKLFSLFLTVKIRL